jgi:hypothetical protein
VQFVGDTTVWDAVMARPVQPTADLSDIYILRADPQHPLVIPVDLEKMLENGDSGDNVLLREDDIVVVNPNFFGVLQNLVELILSPLQPVVQLVSGLNQIENQYNSLTGDEDGYYGGYYGGGYNSNYNQGFGQVGGQ